MKKKEVITLILCFVAVFLVAFLGSRITITDSWYDSVKPSITPPSFVFPIVWTILFILLALSMFLSLTNANKKEKRMLYVFFGANLILNFLWSFFYFGLHNVLFAFVDLILLWITILILVILTWKINRIASWMIVPYLVWVSFAGVLNWLSI